MKSAIKKVEVDCNNCGSDQTETVTSGREHEYPNTTDDFFKVVRCRQCGLHYLNPRPDVSELTTIYPASYYAYHLQENSAATKGSQNLLFRARRHIYLSRLEQALADCHPAEPLRVLDIGCADGRALNWYKQLEKYKIETHGVDFDETAVVRARELGHIVYQGRFETVEMPENYFDLAVATHVIEHVADPRAFVSRALSVLKPGGILLLETPNIKSLDASFYKNKHWGGYHFPRHWVFYDATSLSRLSVDAGFEVEKIDYHPAPAFWNWTFHSLFSGNSPPPEDSPARLVDWLFPPTDFQKNTIKNLCAVSAFTALDILQKLFTGKTSNMSVRLRKPIDSTAN